MKEYFLKNSDDGLCAYRLLCGSEKGRALRDIIIHQANVNLIYSEYRENSEKERLFLILKNEGAGVLNIEHISVYNQALTVSMPTRLLQPGESMKMKVPY